MVEDLFGNLIKYLRSINRKYFRLRLFRYLHIIRSKFQLILFFFNPSFAYFASLKRHKLPSSKEKFIMKKSVLDDIILLDNKLKFDEVNIFLRGFGKDFKQMKNEKNKMLVNYAFLKNKNLKEDNNYTVERELFIPNFDCFHVGDGFEVDECKLRNIPFILIKRCLNKNYTDYQNEKENNRDKAFENYIEKNSISKMIKFYFNTSCKTLRTGSGLNSILVFSKISKKVNIYGWDFYMNKKPENLSKFNAYNLMAPKNKYFYTDNYFEYFICNVVFLKRLLNIENISIKGYLKDYVINNPEIVNKCFKIIYKS